MRKNIIGALPLFIVVFILSGCSKPAPSNTAEQQKQPEQTQQQDLGYINNMIGIKEKAAQDVAKATEQENKKIADALEQTETNTPANIQYSSAILHTTLGDITVKLYAQDAPKTVANFIKLASSNFYDKTTFHRVIKGFMIQGGDPNSKDSDKSNDGKGGPGYTFQDEFNSKKLVRGSLAMANSGPNTNGSQFFIVTAASTPWLDGKHTNFGEVTSGLDIVDKIENSQTDTTDHPVTDIAIKSVELIK
jgi:cyclophilin family peptidyl-prolyl cis-trans isomerase